MEPAQAREARQAGCCFTGKFHLCSVNRKKVVVNFIRKATEFDKRLVFLSFYGTIMVGVF